MRVGCQGSTRRAVGTDSVERQRPDRPAKTAGIQRLGSTAFLGTLQALTLGAAGGSLVTLAFMRPALETAASNGEDALYLEKKISEGSNDDVYVALLGYYGRRLASGQLDKLNQANGSVCQAL